MNELAKELEVLIKRHAEQISEDVSEYKDSLDRVARLIRGFERKLNGNIEWEIENNFPLEQLQSEAQRLLIIELVEELNWDSNMNEAFKRVRDNDE